MTLLSRIPPFHSELRCKYLLSANILPAQSYLHILFVPDAICQWNASTNTFVITVGRHLAGKAFPIPPLPLLDFYSNRVCSLLAPFDAYEVSVPRDRKGEFELQLLKKNQTSGSQDIEEKILSMYAKGMTTGDIETHIRDIYGIEVSDSTVSRITDKILPIAKEWQQRPLESVYAVVFLDAIHYHVRSEGQIVKKAVYIAIGIDLDGKKDVLGMWVGENESAKFWASVLNSLRNRGVQDIFIACTDNLTGFSAAIEAVFPKTEIQNCIIHQLRNSSKYVSYKDLKELMADLKAVYAAADEQSALNALDTFAERWDKKYPKISQSWRENWANLSTYFKYERHRRFQPAAPKSDKIQIRFSHG